MNGKWINIDETEKFECSCCKKMMWFPKQYGLSGDPIKAGYNFCPNCGADMRKENND